MILLLGGTTEGKEVARWLDGTGISYIYSTRSEVKFEGGGNYRYGALDAVGFKFFCQKHKVEKIINASHPFASELHKEVANLAPDIRLIRYERAFPERIMDPLVIYVDDYSEALDLLGEHEISSLLVLSGVQSIPKLRGYWEKNKAWFRILDRPESWEFARHHAFPAEQLLAGFPQDEQEETLLLRKLQVQAILTKESGFNGNLPQKIAAACNCGIPVYILKKPSLPQAYQVVKNREALFELLNH